MSTNKPRTLTDLSQLKEIAHWQIGKDKTIPIHQMETHHIGGAYLTILKRFKKINAFKYENKTLIEDYNTQIKYNEEKVAELQNQLEGYRREIYRINGERSQVLDRDIKNNQSYATNQAIHDALLSEVTNRGTTFQKIIDEITALQAEGKEVKEIA